MLQSFKRGVKVSFLLIPGLLIANDISAKELKKKSTQLELTAGQIEFLTEQKVLRKKLDMCVASIKYETRGSKTVCNDAVESNSYITKGDDSAYFNYNLEAGNMDNGLLDVYYENLKKMRSALQTATY